MARAPDAGGYFVGDYEGLISIGPIVIPFFAKSGGSDANRNDIYAHIALGNFLNGAASNAATVERQIADEEAALPALYAQGLAQVPESVRTALRASTWRAFDRFMRARVPDWDARHARRMQPQ